MLKVSALSFVELDKKILEVFAIFSDKVSHPKHPEGQGTSDE